MFSENIMEGAMSEFENSAEAKIAKKMKSGIYLFEICVRMVTIQNQASG